MVLSEKVDENGHVLKGDDGRLIMERSQMTIGWHVDDFSITHGSQAAINQLIQRLDKQYGNMEPLKVHTGDVHEYLGMTLDFRQPEKVKGKMDRYVEELLDAAPEELKCEVETPAAHHLFDVNPDAERLDRDKAAAFHHLVARSLFLCKRARSDLQLAVSFLCGRVKKLDWDDCKKFGRLLKFLRTTSDLHLTMEEIELTMPKWWIDASFATHQDYRSHTGGVISLGKGAMYAASLKQKLNCKSPTESEFVAVDDFIGQVL